MTILVNIFENCDWRRDQESCTSKIEDGLSALRHTLELDPENADAMSYLNLTYRFKASLAGTPGEALSFVEEAQQWADRALEVKRKKANEHPPGN